LHPEIVKADVVRRRQYGQDIAILIAKHDGFGNAIAGDPAGLGATHRRLGRFVRNHVIGDVLGSQIFFECRGNGHIRPSSATGKPRTP
jgi:hypothetical protein